MDEDLSLSLQIDLGIDVGCVDGNVPEPSTDSVDVDTGAQQVRGCRVANGMRADGPAEQRRMRS